MKGFVGGMLVAAMNNSNKEGATNSTREMDSDDSEENSDKEE